jgi:hypothetical protein
MNSDYNQTYRVSKGIESGMKDKPQTEGLAALLRKDKERKARAGQKSEADAQGETESIRRMKFTDAVKYLRTSKDKLRSLIKEGRLTLDEDPLDKRRKLLRVDELDQLKQASVDKD